MLNKTPINEKKDIKEILCRRSDFTKEIILVPGDQVIELRLSTK